MELNLGQWIVMGISAVLLVIYARGYFYNRQQAGRISAWLLEGLKEWGEVSAGEKLPNLTSGGKMEIQHPAAPFKKVEVVFLLAPRENPLFWIFYVLQGKRDELLVWITYQARPEQTVEVARSGNRVIGQQFENRLKSADKPALALIEAPRGWQIASEQKEGAGLAGKVQEFVQRYRLLIERLALRPTKPHLFLRANLAGVRDVSAPEFFRALSELRK